MIKIVLVFLINRKLNNKLDLLIQMQTLDVYVKQIFGKIQIKYASNVLYNAMDVLIQLNARFA